MSNSTQAATRPAAKTTDKCRTVTARDIPAEVDVVMVSYGTFHSIQQHISHASYGINTVARILYETVGLNEDEALPEYLEFLDTGLTKGGLHSCILELSNVFRNQADLLEEIEAGRVEDCLSRTYSCESHRQK